MRYYRFLMASRSTLRVRANAPASFAAIRPMALDFVRTCKGRLSVKANLKADA